MSFKKVDAKVSFPKMEEEILKFWDEERIFEKSVKKDSPDGDFIFYEGPPTANGHPGLHHVLARSFKDIIPRYKTMKGYRVERKAGWDTHGLPVELQVEKALGLKNKQDIESIVPGDARASIIEFNKKCKESVWEYRDLWEKMTKRMGYWVDMEHPYVTYENDYIESVWWQLAQIAELKNAKGESFLYKGHKVVPYCYRCGTALSSHEVAQGYQTVKDNSAYVKFRAKAGQKIGDFTTDENTYFLAWTTTPWTLPGNVALAVNEGNQYFIAEVEANDSKLPLQKKEKIIIGNDTSIAINIFGEPIHFGAVSNHEGDNSWASVTYKGGGNILFKNVDYFQGKSILSLEYEPFYPIENKGNKKVQYVVPGDFVTTDSGTGVVHIAPAFGEDDANVAKENDLPTLLTVEVDGTLSKGFGLPGEGVPVKKKNDKNRYAVDDLITEDLKQRDLFFKEEVYEHEYPFCWRCDTPLIYYAKPSWFIRMSEVRDELMRNNEEITWVPEHIREGRFGEWLSGVKDWAISRERYWGTPLPIWECEHCDGRKAFSSIEELKKFSGKTLEDVHKPYIDDISWLCACGGNMKRTPEVLDVWFDSGAMPLAQYHHLGTGSVEKYFPADYICEAIDQTRGWFYTLHAIATLLHRAGKVPAGHAYKNVICLAHILDAHGKKMSKSKGNVIDPFQMFEEYGADALRWMLFSMNQPGIPKRFDVKGMRDVMNRVFRMLWNSYSFFTTYASIDAFVPKPDMKSSANLLDRWILSELQLLVQEVDESLTGYDVYASTKKIEAFIDNLSNWYIRRSRKRFWKSEDDGDKENAYQTLYDVLVTLAKVMAPFTPFVAEEIYRNLTNKESVHLADWPEADGKLIDEKLNEEMRSVRHLVTEGLKLRADAKIKVRQPLGESRIKNQELRDESLDILKEELNVKNIIADVSLGNEIVLNTEITEELKLEGEAREIIRAIQEGRKKAGFNVENRIALGYQGKEKVFAMFGEMIAKEILATEVKNEQIENAEYSDSIELEGEKFVFQLKRV